MSRKTDSTKTASQGNARFTKEILPASDSTNEFVVAAGDAGTSEATKG